MTDEQYPATPPQQRALVRTNTEEAPMFYSNNLLLQTSVWDFKLAFGIVADATEDSLMVKSVVTVMVSPQHAKALNALLTRQLKQYESQYGPIPQDHRTVEVETEVVSANGGA